MVITAAGRGTFTLPDGRRCLLDRSNTDAVRLRQTLSSSPAAVWRDYTKPGGADLITTVLVYRGRGKPRSARFTDTSLVYLPAPLRAVLDAVERIRAAAVHRCDETRDPNPRE